MNTIAYMFRYRERRFSIYLCVCCVFVIASTLYASLHLSVRLRAPAGVTKEEGQHMELLFLPPPSTFLLRFIHSRIYIIRVWSLIAGRLRLSFSLVDVRSSNYLCIYHSWIYIYEYIQQYIAFRIPPARKCWCSRKIRAHRDWFQLLLYTGASAVSRDPLKNHTGDRLLYRANRIRTTL